MNDFFDEDPVAYPTEIDTRDGRNCTSCSSCILVEEEDEDHDYYQFYCAKRLHPEGQFVVDWYVDDRRLEQATYCSGFSEGYGLRADADTNPADLDPSELALWNSR